MKLEEAARLALKRSLTIRRLARKSTKLKDSQRKYLRKEGLALSKLAWYAINGSK